MGHITILRSRQVKMSANTFVNLNIFHINNESLLTIFLKLFKIKIEAVLVINNSVSERQ